MNYTLHQLQVFFKITQTQSITKAAEELYLTQPAVSIQLRNFQDQFDIPLTEVVGRKLYITDFGREIAEAAEKILNEVYAINYKTLAYKGQLTGRLKVSVVSTGKYVMPFFLAPFLKQHEGVELVMDVTNKAQVIESLERNEVDFSLVSVLPDTLPLLNVELMPNRLYLVANTDTKYPGQPYDWSVFETLPLIYREKGSGTRSVMEKFFDSSGIKLRKKLELTSNEAVKQAVLAGLGCSIMPIIGLKNELRNQDLRIIPVKGFPISSTWQLVWMKNKNLSPVAVAFLDYLKREKQTIIQDKFSWIEA
ncbi:LysR family transcriptional regulator [Rhabdobacter roseus]|uniref:DNA-binding transcriptional LysR family regulator n=1 Tax=Rhabdobacter roseus TaxID=1655419 RepID=A0A840TMC6_9BACT|nr:LysR family transcriptional regulator [Rhabdobacter roseus]MBB5285396.1 DNA-binding transcriptional LysR family regulator [Rhabdobacter roseus]